MFERIEKLFKTESDPDGGASYCAFLYDEPEYYEAAIENILNKINKGKGNTHHFNNLGVLYWEIGEIEKAIEAFNKSMDLNKKNSVPYKNLGMFEEKQGNYETALKYFEKAVTAQPEDYSLNLNNAYALMKLDRHKDAIPYFLKAIDLGFNNDYVSNKLSETYLKIGDEQNAQHYKELAKRMA